MSAISSILSRFTGGARRPAAGGTARPTTGATGGTRSTDEAIGRGVRTALGKLRGRR